MSEPKPVVRPLPVRPLPVRSVPSLLNANLSPPQPLLGPITAGSMGMLYGWRGAGKTLLATEIALAIATGRSALKADAGGFPQWSAPAPVPVLYVAGEMSGWTFRQRLLAQCAQRDPRALTLVLNEDLVLAGLPALNLSLAACRAQIDDALARAQARFIVLDNLDTLMDDPTDEEAYRPVGQWITRLTLQGLAVLVIHHAGKSGDQRGTSRRESPLDYVLRLETIDDDSARLAFRVSFTKARFVDKLLARSFAAEFLPLESPPRWKFSSSQESKLEQFLDIVATTGTFRYKDVAQEMAIAYSHVYRLRAKAIERGQWETSWNTGRTRLRPVTN